MALGLVDAGVGGTEHDRHAVRRMPREKAVQLRTHVPHRVEEEPVRPHVEFRLRHGRQIAGNHPEEDTPPRNVALKRHHPGG